MRQAQPWPGPPLLRSASTVTFASGTAGPYVSDAQSQGTSREATAAKALRSVTPMVHRSRTACAGRLR
jgi:hypothetical protein